MHLNADFTGDARYRSVVGPSFTDGRGISLAIRNSRLPVKGSPTGQLHRLGAAVLLLLGLAVHTLRAQTPPAAPPAEPGSSKTFIYKLTPGDRIRVEVSGEPELARNVRIDAQGRISLSWIEDVKVAGLTVDEAKQAIEAAYREGRILRRPEAKISVEDYAPRLVTVNGQVRSPQQVSLPAETFLTVVDAIMRAGGPTDVAKLSAVTVKRTLPDGTVQTRMVDIESVIRDKGGDKTKPADSTLHLEPGDIIYVPERLF